MPLTGRGRKVKSGEKRRYDQLIEAGWSPEKAAESIHRSKSWAYEYEKQKREEALGSVRGRGLSVHQQEREFERFAERLFKKMYHPNGRPAENLSDAVDVVLLHEEQDLDALFDLVDRFGLPIVFSVAELAAFLARLYVRDYLRPKDEETMDPEELVQEDAELAAEGATELEPFLTAIPILLDNLRAGRPLETMPSFDPSAPEDRTTNNEEVSHGTR